MDHETAIRLTNLETAVKVLADRLKKLESKDKKEKEDNSK